MTAAHKTGSPFYTSPRPVIVAERARDATTIGRCALCHRAWRRGDRIADLVDGRGSAHVGCTSQAAGVTR